jgi:hypothetical protein
MYGTTARPGLKCYISTFSLKANQVKCYTATQKGGDLVPSYQLELKISTHNYLVTRYLPRIPRNTKRGQSLLV